jgi:hypothetical protein
MCCDAMIVKRTNLEYDKYLRIYMIEGPIVRLESSLTIWMEVTTWQIVDGSR